MDAIAMISKAVRRLADGRLVAFPTETVYGLGADALSPEAVSGVYLAKGRPSSNPLIVHVSGANMAQRVASIWNETAETLAEAFWPGPLTIVLPKQDIIPDSVTAGGSTVAVRAPDHPLAMALIESFGGPIVGPSANPSGYVSPTRAEHVRSHFSEDQVLVLDGGRCRAGIESTVIDASDIPRILRKGVISGAELSVALGKTVLEDGPSGEPKITSRSALASPGLLGPHYQPRAKVILCKDASTIEQAVAEVSTQNRLAVVLSPPGERIKVDPPHLVFQMPESAAAYASELYEVLRKADDAAASTVIVGTPISRKGLPIWEAVLDRLIRASS